MPSFTRRSSPSTRRRRIDIPTRFLRFRQKQHKKPGDLEGSAKQYCAGIEEMARKCLDLILPYLAKRKARLKKLAIQKEPCPNCGRSQWVLGYPDGTPTGFVKF